MELSFWTRYGTFTRQPHERSSRFDRARIRWNLVKALTELDELIAAARHTESRIGLAETRALLDASRIIEKVHIAIADFELIVTGIRPAEGEEDDASSDEARIQSILEYLVPVAIEAHFGEEAVYCDIGGIRRPVDPVPLLRVRYPKLSEIATLWESMSLYEYIRDEYPVLEDTVWPTPENASDDSDNSCHHQ